MPGPATRRGRDGRNLPQDWWQASGVSIDTRSLLPGDLFVALCDVRDGHAIRRRRPGPRRCGSLSSRRPKVAPDAPSSSPMLEGCAALPVPPGEGFAVGWSPSPVRSARPAPRCCAPRSAPRPEFMPPRRATTTIGACRSRGMPAEVDYAVIRDRHERPRRDRTARAARPVHVAMITTIRRRPSRWRRSATLLASPAKAAIFEGWSRGTAVLNRDIAAHLSDPAARRARRPAAGRFSTHRRLRIPAARDPGRGPARPSVSARAHGQDFFFKLQERQGVSRFNALRRARRGQALGADLVQASLACCRLALARGAWRALDRAARPRRARRLDRRADRELQRQLPRWLPRSGLRARSRRTGLAGR